jgi:hypothetical protein
MSGSIIGQNATACAPQMMHLQSDALVIVFFFMFRYTTSISQQHHL